MNCYVCSKVLVPVKGNEDTNYQYENALEIGFCGGYGMFTDNISNSLTGLPDESAMLCHDCMHDLCDKVSWIKQLIRPETSHTHTVDFIKENPDHYGPDYNG